MERKSNFLSSQNTININKIDAPQTNILRESLTLNQNKNERNQSPSRSRLPVRMTQKKNSPQKKEPIRRTLKPPKFDIPTFTTSQDTKNENTSNNYNSRSISKYDQKTTYSNNISNKRQNATNLKPTSIINMQDINSIKTETISKKEIKTEANTKKETKSKADINLSLSGELQLRPVQKIVPPKQKVKVREIKVNKEETISLINSLMDDKESSLGSENLNEKESDDDNSLDDFVSQEKLASKEDKINTKNESVRQSQNYQRTITTASYLPLKKSIQTSKNTATAAIAPQTSTAANKSTKSIEKANKTNTLKKAENKQQSDHNSNNYSKQSKSKTMKISMDDISFPTKSNQSINFQQIDAFIAMKKNSNLNFARLSNLRKSENSKQNYRDYLQKNENTAVPEPLKKEFLREQPQRAVSPESLNESQQNQRQQYKKSLCPDRLRITAMRTSKFNQRPKQEEETNKIGTYTNILKSRKNKSKMNNEDNTKKNIEFDDMLKSDDSDSSENKFSAQLKKKNLGFKVGTEDDVKQPKIFVQPMQLLMSNQRQSRFIQKNIPDDDDENENINYFDDFQDESMKEKENQKNSNSPQRKNKIQDNKIKDEFLTQTYSSISENSSIEPIKKRSDNSPQAQKTLKQINERQEQQNYNYFANHKNAKNQSEDEIDVENEEDNEEEEFNYFIRSVKNSPKKDKDEEIEEEDSDGFNEDLKSPINRSDFFARINNNETSQLRNITSNNYVSRNLRINVEDNEVNPIKSKKNSTGNDTNPRKKRNQFMRTNDIKKNDVNKLTRNKNDRNKNYYENHFEEEDNNENLKIQKKPIANDSNRNRAIKANVYSRQNTNKNQNTTKADETNKMKRNLPNRNKFSRVSTLSRKDEIKKIDKNPSKPTETKNSINYKSNFINKNNKESLNEEEENNEVFRKPQLFQNDTKAEIIKKQENKQRRSLKEKLLKNISPLKFYEEDENDDDNNESERENEFNQPNPVIANNKERVKKFKPTQKVESEFGFSSNYNTRKVGNQKRIDFANNLSPQSLQLNNSSGVHEYDEDQNQEFTDENETEIEEEEQIEIKQNINKSEKQNRFNRNLMPPKFQLEDDTTTNKKVQKKNNMNNVSNKMVSPERKDRLPLRQRLLFDAVDEEEEEASEFDEVSDRKSNEKVSLYFDDEDEVIENNRNFDFKQRKPNKQNNFIDNEIEEEVFEQPINRQLNKNKIQVQNRNFLSRNSKKQNLSPIQNSFEEDDNEALNDIPSPKEIKSQNFRLKEEWQPKVNNDRIKRNSNRSNSPIYNSKKSSNNQTSDNSNYYNDQQQNIDNADYSPKFLHSPIKRQNQTQNKQTFSPSKQETKISDKRKVFINKQQQMQQQMNKKNLKEEDSTSRFSQSKFEDDRTEIDIIGDDDNMHSNSYSIIPPKQVRNEVNMNRNEINENYNEEENVEEFNQRKQNIRKKEAVALTNKRQNEKEFSDDFKNTNSPSNNKSKRSNAISTTQSDNSQSTSLQAAIEQLLKKENKGLSPINMESKQESEINDENQNSSSFHQKNSTNSVNNSPESRNDLNYLNSSFPSGSPLRQNYKVESSPISSSPANKHRNNEPYFITPKVDLNSDSFGAYPSPSTTFKSPLEPQQQLKMQLQQQKIEKRNRQQQSPKEEQQQIQLKKQKQKQIQLEKQIEMEKQKQLQLDKQQKLQKKKQPLETERQQHHHLEIQQQLQYEKQQEHPIPQQPLQLQQRQQQTKKVLLMSSAPITIECSQYSNDSHESVELKVSKSTSPQQMTTTTTITTITTTESANNYDSPSYSPRSPYNKRNEKTRFSNIPKKQTYSPSRINSPSKANSPSRITSPSRLNYSPYSASVSPTFSSQSHRISPVRAEINELKHGSKNSNLSQNQVKFSATSPSFIGPSSPQIQKIKQRNQITNKESPVKVEIDNLKAASKRAKIRTESAKNKLLMNSNHNGENNKVSPRHFRSESAPKTQAQNNEVYQEEHKNSGIETEYDANKHYYFVDPKSEKNITPDKETQYSSKSKMQFSRVAKDDNISLSNREIDGRNPRENNNQAPNKSRFNKVSNSNKEIIEKDSNSSIIEQRIMNDSNKLNSLSNRRINSNTATNKSPSNIETHLTNPVADQGEHYANDNNSISSLHEFLHMEAKIAAKSDESHNGYINNENNLNSDVYDGSDDMNDLSTDRSLNRIIASNKNNFIELSESSGFIQTNNKIQANSMNNQIESNQIENEAEEEDNCNVIQFINKDDLNEFNLFKLSDVSSSNEEENDDEEKDQQKLTKFAHQINDNIVPLNMSDMMNSSNVPNESESEVSNEPSRHIERIIQFPRNDSNQNNKNASSALSKQHLAQNNEYNLNKNPQKKNTLELLNNRRRVPQNETNASLEIPNQTQREMPNKTLIQTQNESKNQKERQSLNKNIFAPKTTLQNENEERSPLLLEKARNSFRLNIEESNGERTIRKTKEDDISNNKSKTNENECNKDRLQKHEQLIMKEQEKQKEQKLEQQIKKDQEKQRKVNTNTQIMTEQVNLQEKQTKLLKQAKNQINNTQQIRDINEKQKEVNTEEKEKQKKGQIKPKEEKNQNLNEDIFIDYIEEEEEEIKDETIESPNLDNFSNDEKEYEKVVTKKFSIRTEINQSYSNKDQNDSTEQQSNEYLEIDPRQISQHKKEKNNFIETHKFEYDEIAKDFQMSFEDEKQAIYSANSSAIKVRFDDDESDECIDAEINDLINKNSSPINKVFTSTKTGSENIRSLNVSNQQNESTIMKKNSKLNEISKSKSNEIPQMKARNQQVKNDYSNKDQLKSYSSSKEIQIISKKPETNQTSILSIRRQEIKEKINLNQSSTYENEEKFEEYEQINKNQKEDIYKQEDNEEEENYNIYEEEENKQEFNISKEEEQNENIIEINSNQGIIEGEEQYQDLHNINVDLEIEEDTNENESGITDVQEEEETVHEANEEEDLNKNEFEFNDIHEKEQDEKLLDIKANQKENRNGNLLDIKINQEEERNENILDIEANPEEEQNEKQFEIKGSQNLQITDVNEKETVNEEEDENAVEATCDNDETKEEEDNEIAIEFDNYNEEEEQKEDSQNISIDQIENNEIQNLQIDNSLQKLSDNLEPDQFEEEDQIENIVYNLEFTEEEEYSESNMQSNLNQEQNEEEENETVEIQSENMFEIEEEEEEQSFAINSFNGENSLEEHNESSLINNSNHEENKNSSINNSNQDDEEEKIKNMFVNSNNKEIVKVDTNEINNKNVKETPEEDESSGSIQELYFDQGIDFDLEKEEEKFNQDLQKVNYNKVIVKEEVIVQKEISNKNNSELKDEQMRDIHEDSSQIQDINDYQSNDVNEAKFEEEEEEYIELQKDANDDQQAFDEQDSEIVQNLFTNESENYEFFNEEETERSNQTFDDEIKDQQNINENESKEKHETYVDEIEEEPEQIVNNISANEKEIIYTSHESFEEEDMIENHDSFIKFQQQVNKEASYEIEEETSNSQQPFHKELNNIQQFFEDENIENEEEEMIKDHQSFTEEEMINDDLQSFTEEENNETEEEEIINNSQSFNKEDSNNMLRSFIYEENTDVQQSFNEEEDISPNQQSFNKDSTNNDHSFTEDESINNPQSFNEKVVDENKSLLTEKEEEEEVEFLQSINEETSNISQSFTEEANQSMSKEKSNDLQSFTEKEIKEQISNNYQSFTEEEANEPFGKEESSIIRSFSENINSEANKEEMSNDHQSFVKETNDNLQSFTDEEKEMGNDDQSFNKAEQNNILRSFIEYENSGIEEKDQELNNDHQSFDKEANDNLQSFTEEENNEIEEEKETSNNQSFNKEESKYVLLRSFIDEENPEEEIDNLESSTKEETNENKEEKDEYNDDIMQIVDEIKGFQQSENDDHELNKRDSNEEKNQADQESSNFIENDYETKEGNKESTSNIEHSEIQDEINSCSSQTKTDSSDISFIQLLESDHEQNKNPENSSTMDKNTSNNEVVNDNSSISSFDADLMDIIDEIDSTKSPSPSHQQNTKEKDAFKFDIDGVKSNDDYDEIASNSDQEPKKQSVKTSYVPIIDDNKKEAEKSMHNRNENDNNEIQESSSLSIDHLKEIENTLSSSFLNVEQNIKDEVAAEEEEEREREEKERKEREEKERIEREEKERREREEKERIEREEKERIEREEKERMEREEKERIEREEREKEERERIEREEKEKMERLEREQLENKQNEEDQSDNYQTSEEDLLISSSRDTTSLLISDSRSEFHSTNYSPNNKNENEVDISFDISKQNNHNFQSNENSQVVLEDEDVIVDDDKNSLLDISQSPIQKQENNLVSPIIAHPTSQKSMLSSPLTPGKKETKSTENSFDSFEIDGDQLGSQNSSFDPLKTPPDSPLQTDSSEISMISKGSNKSGNQIDISISIQSDSLSLQTEG